MIKFDEGFWASKMPSETKGTPQPISLGDDKDKPKDFRQQCKYGKECYQKNNLPTKTTFFYHFYTQHLAFILTLFFSLAD